MANYRVSFKKGDISFEIESTDKAWLKTKEKEYMKRVGHAKLISTSKADIPKTSSEVSFSGNLTVVEFYKKYVKQNKITAEKRIKKKRG